VIRSLLALAATLSILFCLAPAALAEDLSPLALGSAAPMRDTMMKGADGRERSIASVAGEKGTLVVFTCNSCPWARMWQERVAAIGNEAAKRGFGVLAINANDPAVNPDDGAAEMAKRAKKLGLRFPYVVDGTSDVARAFGASRTPEAFLFDAKGRLVYHGTVDDNARDANAVKEPWLRDAVQAVAAGRAVTTAETKAMGCSIKFRVKS